MKGITLYQAISLVCFFGVLLCPRITMANSSVTREDAEDQPECTFDIILEPELVCQMYDPVAQSHYLPDQKFCACPSFSQCISIKVPHLITRDEETRFVCFKEPTYADKLHEDMTMGLLRREA